MHARDTHVPHALSTTKPGGPLGELVVVVATRLHGQGQRLTCLTTSGPKCPSPISMPSDSGRNARPELSNVSQPPTFGDIQSIWMACQYTYATGVKPPAAPFDQ